MIRKGGHHLDTVSSQAYRTLGRPLAASLVLLAALAAQASPQKPVDAFPKTLLMFAKNPSTWSIVSKGAHGKLIYRDSGAFNLTASRLSPRSAYALIRFSDPPPRGEIIARGTSDARGILVLHGEWRNWSKKFWLLAGEDVSGAPGEVATLKAWHPERYLFEEKELGVPCNDCLAPNKK
jgi:hypothetical protein